MLSLHLVFPKEKVKRHDLSLKHFNLLITYKNKWYAQKLVT